MIRTNLSADGKIRKQIAECALFVPVISAATQSRLEGYFRLEWKLAAQRTQTMANADDGERESFPVARRDRRHPRRRGEGAGEFRAMQWTRLPGGETSAAFAQRGQRLLDVSARRWIFCAGILNSRLTSPRPQRIPSARRAQSGPLRANRRHLHRTEARWLWIQSFDFLLFWPVFDPIRVRRRRRE